MTPERFGELLKRPALLSGQNATELEELIAQYPWCGSFRKLRYRKAIVDGDAEACVLWKNRAEPFLPRANDREFARQLADARPAKAVAHFNFDDSPEEAEDYSGNLLVGDKVESPEGLAYIQDYESDVFAMLDVVATSVETSDWYLHRHGLIMEYGRPKPAARETFDSFHEWKQRRARTSWQDLLRLADEQPKHKKNRKVKRTDADLQPVVASETLADLLAAQGHTDKAVQMYRQLALRYPAKSDTFAAQIEALKQQEV